MLVNVQLFHRFEGFDLSTNSAAILLVVATSFVTYLIISAFCTGFTCWASPAASSSISVTKTGIHRLNKLLF